MSKINVVFPPTDVVACVFSFKNHTNRTNSTTYAFDENGMVVDSDRKSLKRYYYRVPKPLMGELKVGDMVVVNCSTGYQVAEITAINAIAPSSCREKLAYVVGKVDAESYFEYLEQQKHLVMLREQLEVEKKRIESLVTYELLAERNPEFKALLDNFKALGGTIE